MSQVSKFRRAAAVVLSGALIATAVPPVQAMPIPMSREVGQTSNIEEVQYRRRAPAPRHRVVRRKNNGAAAAAAIIGALAIGGAAIAASQSRNRNRAYYDDGYYYDDPGYAYQAAPRHYYQPAPQYYHAPHVDSGSPYAVAPRHVRQRYVQPQYRPDPYAPRRDWRGRYTNPRTGERLAPGVLPPPTGPYQQNIPIPSNN